MKPHIAKCGYRCDLCPAFKTPLTRADKEGFSRAMAQYYDTQIPPEAVKPCNGCQSIEGPPDKECPVYPCVREKGFMTCAECGDFGCEKLQQRMDVVEQILAKQKDVPKDDLERYFKPFLSRQTLMELRRST